MAYVNALMNGRPRKNDPFLGIDDSAQSPLLESFYSLQFVPAYAIAIPARALGISPPMASFALQIVTSIFVCLAIFFLVRTVTGDDLISGVTALVVPCLGTAVALQGQAAHRLDYPVLIEFFAYLRVYQPAFAIPFFFLFCLSIFKMFSSSGRRNQIIYTFVSVALFVVLVFSYFYLWTAAAAWAACFILAWLVLRPAERRITLGRAVVLGILLLLELVPYALLISNRSTKTDEIQILTATRQLDLLRLPELLGLIIALILVVVAWYRRNERAQGHFIFVLSVALTPFVLFNQQVLTGRSLQPFHYEIFAANYLILVALPIVLWIIFGGQERARWFSGLGVALLLLTFAAVGWGYIESSRFARRNIKGAVERDEATLALNYVNELEDERVSATNERAGYATVFAADWSVIELIPVVTRCRPLWNLHSSAAGGLDRREERQLFYHYLYYSGIDMQALTEAIDEKQFLVMVPLFGYEKAVPGLGREDTDVSQDEIDNIVAAYRKFVEDFDLPNAVEPILDYAVVTEEQRSLLTNLDRWYERDAGQEMGKYTVYRLSLKRK